MIKEFIEFWLSMLFPVKLETVYPASKEPEVPSSVLTQLEVNKDGQEWLLRNS